MVIEEGDGSIKFKQAMRKIWVQMAGLPYELRYFPTIWAIGTILGVTKDVDKGFTRNFDRARLQVLVLNPELIPLSVDVVIGDYIYELHFRVEPEDGQDMPTPMDMDDDDGNHRADDGTENNKKDGKATEVQPNLNSAKSGEKSQISNHSNGNQGSHGGQRMVYHIPALEWVPDDEMDEAEMGEELQQQAGIFFEDDMAIAAM
jgi:hypothetical protein